MGKRAPVERLPFSMHPQFVHRLYFLTEVPIERIHANSGDPVRFIFLLFLAIPVVELFVLIQVGSEIGALPTILLVFLTAAVGILLLRRQGYASLLRARQKMAEGQLPAEEMLGGLFLAAGGLLLLIPGFVTDVVGLAFLLPPLRAILVRRLARRFAGSGRFATSIHQQRSSHVIDGEFERDERDNRN